MVKKHIARGYAFLVYLFLYLPILLMILYSFNDSRYGGNWSGFTLRWYSDLLRDRSIMESLYTTLIVAVTASVISTIIGTISAVAIHNMKPKGKALMSSLSYIPMVNPDIVIGISLPSLFVLFNMKLGYLTLILAHITFNIPYVIFAVLPKLQQLNPNIEEAAMDLGATPVQAFFKVVLPELMPGIVTGALLAFTLSIDDFIVRFFTTGSGVSTLSIRIYSMTKRGLSRMINALSSIMFISVLVLMLVLQLRDNKKEEIN